MSHLITNVIANLCLNEIGKKLNICSLQDTIILRKQIIDQKKYFMII